MERYHRKSLTKSEYEDLSVLHGSVCVNCGSSVGIEWHHIVPLFLGGTDVASNIVSLCHACHCAAHRGRHVSHYVAKSNKAGRPPKVPSKEAFKALDMLADGKIGILRCKQLMGIARRTEPRRTSQFKRWCAARGVVDVRNILDVRITNGSVADGDVIGEVEYADGTKNDIIFNDVGANDMVKYVTRSRAEEGERTFWEIKMSALAG